MDPSKKEHDSLPENFKNSIKEALQTITKYASVLEDSASVTTEETKLPQFWQDLKSARNSFEKFNIFYARKYA